MATSIVRGICAALAILADAPAVAATIPKVTAGAVGAIAPAL